MRFFNRNWKSFLVGFCVVFPVTLFAQTNTNNSSIEGAIGKTVPSFDVQDFDSIQTPVSPAFTLLGIAPTSIDKPTTPSAVGASLLSATGNGQGGVPKNVAIQFSPYWLFPQPTLTFSKYYNSSVPETMLHTLSLSFGTAESDITNTAGTQKGTAIATGLSFNLFSGSKSPDLDADVAQYNKDADAFLNGPMTDDSSLRADAAKITQADKERVGFSLSCA